MTICEPPERLENPTIVTLPFSTLLQRVHDRQFDANNFNPCQGAPTRFAPVCDIKNCCVPSLYAADTMEAAIYETIFHDVSVTARLRTVPRTLVQSRAHGRLEVLRDLRLVSLRSPDLRRWRISRNSLITTSPKFYWNTARWAEAIHHQFPNVEGLLWTSNQCDPDTAYLFFGDRVAPSDFDILETRDGMKDQSFLSDVWMAGRRSKIAITD